MNLRKAVPNIAFGFSARRGDIGVVTSSDKPTSNFTVILSFPFAETLFAQKRIGFDGGANRKGSLVGSLEIRREN